MRFAGLVDANTPDARSALLFYAGTPHRRRQASFVISRLLKGLTDRESAQISTVILAAEIAIAAGADTHDGALIQAFSDIWPAAGALQRRTIAVTLARLKPDRALETLWEYSQDASYQVSWAAASALAGEPAPPGIARSDRAAQAASSLNEKFSACIAEGQALKQRARAKPNPELDDWNPLVRRLKALGWILPVLAVGASNTTILGDIDAVLELFALAPGETGDGLTKQRGPEGSIAQGFKAAARLAAWDAASTPGTEIFRELFQRSQALHRRARFWYSRLVLLHGMTDLVLAVEHDDALNHALEAEVAEARETIKHQACRKRCGVAKPNHPLGRATGYEHAFVVEAATLCQQLLDAAQGVDNDRGRNREELRELRERYIWDDEGLAVATPAATLEPRALRLLGETAILLNLNEKGAGEQPDSAAETKDFELREEFGSNDHLPVCLSDRRQRKRIVVDGSACPDDCVFHRCSYPVTVSRAHRELSKAFCRAVRRTEWQGPPAWQPKLRHLAYARFWLEMERKAKFG